MVNGEITTTDCGYASAVDLQRDILKIAVVERHQNTGHIGIGYLQGYGLRSGAVATSVSHDSHNIIVVGTNDLDMAFAVNHIAQQHGGIAVVSGQQVLGNLPLEIAGIMSGDTLVNVNEKLEAAKEAAYRLGVNREIDPFMTLSLSWLCPSSPPCASQPAGSSTSSRSSISRQNVLQEKSPAARD